MQRNPERPGARRSTGGAAVTASIGILLINLGTPEATDPASMRRYLKEFMSDPRVIERRGLWWWALLNGVIIPRRARKSARA
ncbi:MAG: ferrochelatase, partial [Rhodobacteraceae bacterium]|nr:ferrochelatase [Paracoccaceae bacterium]